MKTIIFLLTGGPMLGALAGYLIGKKEKKYGERMALLFAAGQMITALTAAFLYHTGTLAGRVLEISGFGGLGLSFVLDGFRVLLLCLASFMWLVSMLVSPGYFKSSEKKNRYYLFLMVTLGAVSGVFLSGDIFTTFLFFEMMSFTSYVWVIHEESQEAMRAGQTYLAIAILGGMVMLMGIFLLYYHTGTLQYALLLKEASNVSEQKWIVIAALCLLFGFGAKAGAFPLHIWLPKAHPVAPAPASALLSGILTKTGIFGILLISTSVMAGNAGFGKLLLFLGTCTMLIGGVLAMFGLDIKRTLACSSVSQIGFILMGAGSLVLLKEEGIQAGAGVVLYIINHALFKLLLFGCAGIIYQNAHSLDVNILRGFGRKKPLLAAMFFSGSLGIGGIPLFSGYIGKTLIHEGIAEYGAVSGSLWIKAAEWLFIFGGAMTVAYMLKLCIALFIEKNPDAGLQETYDSQTKYMSISAASGLFITAVLFPILGILPNWTLEKLADFSLGFLGFAEPMRPVPYFSPANLKFGILSLILGIGLYVLVIRKIMMKREEEHRVYVDRWNPKWDLENTVYRPVIFVCFLIALTVCRVLDRLVDYIVVALRKTAYRDSQIPYELEEGNLATHVVGTLMDDGKYVLNRTLYRKYPIRVSYEHRLAMFREEFRENNSIISRSLSFGLMLFGIGLMLTLIYMIWW